MATRAKPKAADKPAQPPGSMRAQLADTADPEQARAHAVLALEAEANAAVVMAKYSAALGATDEGVGALARELHRTLGAMEAGDLKGAERMLYGQAHALQAIFMNLARRATNQEYLKQWEAYLRMALKAQAQCRATLEALAEIKNPRPVAFVKQANISAGHQQVNNGMEPTQPAGSAQGGGGVESLPAPETETALFPTQGLFPPKAEIQTAGGAWPAV